MKEKKQESMKEEKRNLLNKLYEVIGDKDKHLEKYFTGSNATKGSSNCIGGWSRNGVELYSHLCYTITQFRTDEQFGVMKSLFLEEMTKKYGEMKKKGEGNDSKYM